MKIIITLLALLIPAICQAAHANPEKYYQNKWCQERNGQAEAIGQALHYSLQTGKRAGIVLIL